MRNLYFKLIGFYYRARGFETLIGYRYELGIEEEIIEKKYWILK